MRASLPGLASILFGSLAFAQPVHEVPKDWDLALASPTPITVKRDPSKATSGASSVLIATQQGSSTKGFVVLMQMIEATEYRGRRVRFSGDLSSEKVKAWAGLWFRVVDAKGNTLALDNMEKKERRLPGDTDWQRHEIVLDVPERAAKVLYGVTLNGTGKFWADWLELEIVDQSVPVTAESKALKGSVMLPTRTFTSPRNLDFEQ